MAGIFTASRALRDFITPRCGPRTIMGTGAGCSEAVACRKGAVTTADRGGTLGLGGGSGCFFRSMLSAIRGGSGGLSSVRGACASAAISQWMPPAKTRGSPQMIAA